MITNLAWKAYYLVLAFIFYIYCIKLYFNMKENNIRHLTRGVELYNQAQLIQNVDFYGNVTSDTIIVAIQVHDDVDSLVRLIMSLSQAHNIEDTLLIFSHEYYSQEMNDIISKIQFAKAMQIFFPYSMQLNELDFPGDDMMSKFLASRNKTCREAKYTQIKHHWWWKANRIFNQLICTHNFSGDVVFIEDVHHVSEDFVHMVKLLRATANTRCAQCEMLALSVTDQPIPSYLEDELLHLPKIERELTWSVYDNNLKITPFDFPKVNIDFPKVNIDFPKAEIIQWRQNVKVLGLVFNRTVWDSIMQHRDQFCKFNDYHWEYSLINLSLDRLRGPFHLLALKAPRVLYVGKCASDSKRFGCNATTVDRNVGQMFSSAKSYMFPRSLIVTVEEQSNKLYMTEIYGKFDDPRDHELCIDISKTRRRFYEDIFNYAYVRKKHDEPVFDLD